MIETYLIGSVGQSLKRIRQLRQIVQGPYPQGIGLSGGCILAVW